MSYLVFDIETAGVDFESLDSKTQSIVRSWAEKDAKDEKELEVVLEKIKQNLPLSPFLGEVVTISVLDGEGRGGTYFQAPNKEIEDFEEGDVKYRVSDEKGILERFWDIADNYNVFVSFNGRSFDVPYLMIRAAVHGVRPTKNLMTNRYVGMQRGCTHIDLLDQLTFYGAMYPRPNLHFVTTAFGISSPKEGDIEGKDVPVAFKDQRYEEIARYCMADVVATKELYEKWRSLLAFD